MLTKFLISTIFVPFVMILSAVSHGETYTIEVTGRHLYGPGPFPDQKLKTAWIRNLNLEGFLVGKVEGSNNLGEKPNVSGEELQGRTVDGKLSDGTLINEDIDMSNAVIMNGQFNLLLAAVYGGPNKGDTYFYLDEDYNWWIKDDIAIDPGFPAGIVKLNDFTFSTRPRIIPSSLQSELGYPGGTNQIGSITAGRIATGHLGDDDSDGYLDGVFNAIGRFPLQAIFLPGAPFVQLFEFKSDIPVSSLQAALLSVASARSHLKLLTELQITDENHPDASGLREKVGAMLTKSKSHLEMAVSKKAQCSERCEYLKELLEKLKTVEHIQNKKHLKYLVESAYATLIEIMEGTDA